VNSIAKLQDDIAARANADEYFADITVLTERQGDVSNAIDRALKLVSPKGGKIGVAVLIGVVTARVESKDVPGPYFNSCRLSASVFENVLFNAGANGTGKAAVDVAFRLAQILHLYRPAGLAQTLVIEDDAVTPLDAERLPAGEIGYRVAIGAGALVEVLSRCGVPQISPKGGVAPQEVTLACATEGAAIWYTLDGTYPWSGNSGAVLYAAPFSVAAAATLRAVAHKSGLVASDSAAADFT
jgi:hypothetical protein